MAVGPFPGERATGSLGHKPTTSISSVTSTCSPRPFSRPSNLSRPLFGEIIPVCDLYSIANVVVFPSSPSSLSSSPPQSPSRPYSQQHGTGTGTVSHENTPPSPFIEALQNIGLGSPSWSASAISVFTIILPTANGYVTRSDFLKLRLQDFPYKILRSYEPLRPLQKYIATSPTPGPVTSEYDLASLVDSAAGVVQWEDLPTSVSFVDLEVYRTRLTEELRDRLHNAPWLSSTPIPRKRVALIRGRPNITAGGPVYRAAKALGLDLVIVDEEGHWLQADTEENKMHREAFLGTDMTEDAGVVDRIIESIVSYPLPIHGVFTLSDNFFVAVAQVAEALGLPASPVSAFETSVDKYRSRLLQNVPGQTARVSSVEELESLLSAGSSQQAEFIPRFPVIVKPTKGWSSECVSKVNNLGDLATAVQKATSRHGSAAVIEPFFDGPEMDVNFVLLDGEILFSEIADEPPCDADSRSATVHSTFSPEALTLPSALPSDEQDIAKSTLRDILVNIGFCTGVFHVEARMVNSSFEYRKQDDVVDLVRKHSQSLPDSGAECKLIEINARPPGYRVTVPTRHTYGVDYFVAHMLAAAGDKNRLRLTTKPYAHVLGDNINDAQRGAQYWSRLVYIPAPAAGTVQWPSKLAPCEALKRQRPDLADKIVLGVDYCVPGDKVELYTDGARTYVAHLLVVSRESRKDVIRLGDEVQKAFAIDVEAPSKASSELSDGETMVDLDGDGSE
ncbi:hypothetical protein QBC40DRAFT_339133 [Triangularia verruculosa]|uniref:ATP-grasp domain-containing protein n=1 Tax=Triangularia verruculosa TaxID=2587418 RepID=A0AAN6XJL0_9PEZI|nr:hypothetical protein QBC40DRAFT_339133 [Triangularia verruculosa]